MDDLEYIRERIPAYADYPDEEARHLVDMQVRAWVGEALARMRERLGTLPQGLAERLDALMLQCEFTDQRFTRSIDHARLSEDEVDHLHVVDRQLVEAADRAATIEAAALEGYLKKLEGLFRRRSTAVLAPAQA